VRLVIDSGLARIARYDANRGINTLMIEKISQANADQRTGRAGRTAPGNACACGRARNTMSGRRMKCRKSAGSICPKWC
jgi:HrpA-like RNA helicase